MSNICRFSTQSLCLQSGLALLLVCSFATMAQADDQTMRTFYPNDSSSAKSVQYPPQAPGVGQAMQGFSTPSYSNPSYPGSNYPTSSPSASDDSNIPPAVRHLIGPRHLPSAMPNPATMPIPAATPNQGATPYEIQEGAEHQRILNNMRRYGYSEDRIKAVDPYTHNTDPPGTTYRMVNGIRVRNDGMTVDQAFNNIKTNGLMNTPISTDKDYYAPGSYGWYKTHGGTLPFAKWVEGQR
jgi:hypothetical protein